MSDPPAPPPVDLTGSTPDGAAFDGLDTEIDELAADRTERRDHVAAILVCADGARWLPAVLTSLARSERTPHVVVAVDCASTDATTRLLAAAVAQGVVDEVVHVPSGTPFGAAVAAGVARSTPGSGAWAPTQQWLWLLHDDCAPAASALEELLHASDHQPSVGVVGPKVRGWHDHRLLLECGVTVSRGGARVTGLERHEQDQGQRDGVRDVLAVGSAGMLLRRDVWDQLEGFDPGLVMFRDDVDLCWRARRAGHRVVVTGDAVVHHREAGARGQRSVAGRTPGRADRASALRLLLAHAGRLAYPFAYLRLVLATLLRALGFLLAKSPAEARDEIGALGDLLRHPRSLHRSRVLARRAARAPGAVPERAVRALLAPRAGQLRALWDRVVGQLLSSGGDDSATAQELEDGDGWVVPRSSSRVRSLAVRPGFLLALGLLVATVIAVRSLLGSGELVGGALLAAPPGAGDLWNGYLSAWHDIGLGSDAVAPPWLAVLALPAALLRGQAPLAVDAVLLLAVPAAGLSAYLSLRTLVASPWLRCWAAVTYALLPAVTIAVGSGRLGSAALAVLLPPLARSSARLLGAGRPATWRRAWGTGLLLSVAVAFVPGLWPIAVVLAVAAAALRRRLALRLLVAVATPLVLLGPWVLRVWHDPGLLLLEPGITGPADGRVDGLDLVLLHPGGPGSTPLWWTAPVVLAALAALARRSRWRAVLPAWCVVVVAVTFGLVQASVLVEVAGVSGQVRPWPGPAVLVAGAAMITAVVCAADGTRAGFSGASFGWRQPVIAVLAVALLVPPVAATATWVAGVPGPLRRVDPALVPAFVAVDLVSPDRPRVLVLHLRGNHVVYELLNSAAPTLGDRDQAELPPPAVDRAVGALVAGVGGDEVDVLDAWSVKYVLLQGPASRDARLSRALDGQSGLRRVSGDKHTALWRAALAAPRAQAAPSGSDAASSDRVSATTAIPLPVTGNDPVRVDATVPPAARPGTVSLAQTFTPGWVARAGGPTGAVLAGSPTVGLAAGRFTTPVAADTSTIWLTYEDPARTRALWLQLVALLLVVVLALPGRRRHPDEEADDDLPDVELAGPGAVAPPSEDVVAAAADGAGSAVALPVAEGAGGGA